MVLIDKGAEGGEHAVQDLVDVDRDDWAGREEVVVDVVRRWCRRRRSSSRGARAAAAAAAAAASDIAVSTCVRRRVGHLPPHGLEKAGAQTNADNTFLLLNRQ